MRSDSISASVLCLNLKTKGDGTSITAREIAVDIADAVYAPHIVEHIPGVENTVADMLSRKFAPGTTFELPECLRGVEELVLPTRTREFYTTAVLPPELAIRKRGQKMGSSSQDGGSA